jgi:hypothetical protein
VAEYLLELYVSKTDRTAVDRSREAARRATNELTRRGTPVRLLLSIFVPGDETCFFLYEAESVDVVREAARRAALPHGRVAEAVAEPAARNRLMVSAISRPGDAS